MSLSDSPFSIALPLLERFTTSALSALAASSKLERVRVEASQKRLSTRRPRSAGTFLISRSETSVKDFARSRIRSIVARSRSSIDSRCLMPGPPGG